jgi:UV DNA damage repair endonuclease
MKRWAANFQKLSPSCRARMTVENDDVASAFSLEDLLELHKLCGVPLVFDFHHYKVSPAALRCGMGWSGGCTAMQWGGEGFGGGEGSC